MDKLISIKTETGEIFSFKENFFQDISNHPNIVDNTYSKPINSKILAYINTFYEFYYKDDSRKYIFLDKPLKFNNFKQNFKNEWDYKFINNIEINEINSIFEISEILGILELEDLCAAKLADYYKKIPLREMQEKYMLYKSTFSEEELKQLIDQEEDLKIITNKLNKLIKEEQSLEMNIDKEN